MDLLALAQSSPGRKHQEVNQHFVTEAFLVHAQSLACFSQSQHATLCQGSALLSNKEILHTFLEAIHPMRLHYKFKSATALAHVHDVSAQCAHPVESVIGRFGLHKCLYI